MLKMSITASLLTDPADLIRRIALPHGRASARRGGSPDHAAARISSDPSSVAVAVAIAATVIHGSANLDNRLPPSYSSAATILLEGRRAGFAVVGHDRGARVAYRLALDRPECVTRMAVVNIVPTVEQFERMGAGPSLGERGSAGCLAYDRDT